MAAVVVDSVPHGCLSVAFRGPESSAQERPETGRAASARHPPAWVYLRLLIQAVRTIAAPPSNADRTVAAAGTAIARTSIPWGMGLPGGACPAGPDFTSCPPSPRVGQDPAVLRTPCLRQGSGAQRVRDGGELPISAKFSVRAASWYGGWRRHNAGRGAAATRCRRPAPVTKLWSRCACHD